MPQLKYLEFCTVDDFKIHFSIPENIAKFKQEHWLLSASISTHLGEKIL